jgi:hypothetical protein
MIGGTLYRSHVLDCRTNIERQCFSLPSRRMTGIDPGFWVWIAKLTALYRPPHGSAGQPSKDHETAIEP